MARFYVYVVARAKQGTNQGVFKFPLNDLPDYDVLKSAEKYNIYPSHPNYKSVVERTAKYINTTPDNVVFPTAPEISTEDFPPEFYKKAQKSKYEKGDVGYFGAKKKPVKKLAINKKIINKKRK